MCQKPTELARPVSCLRWAIPLILALCGVGYTLFVQGKLHEQTLLSSPVMFGFLFWGLIVPASIWLTLTWAKRATIAAQQELAARNRQLTALTAIGEAASQSLNQEEVLQMSLEKLADLVELDAAGMRLMEGESLVLKRRYGASQDLLQCRAAIPVGYCLCGTCAKSGQTLAVDDIAADPALAAAPCGKAGFRSVASIPLKSADRVVGVLHIASRRRNAFSAGDLQTLTAVGDRLTLAIENARLYEETHRRALHLMTAGLIGQQITALLDLDSLLSRVVQLIQERFGYYHSHILLVDKEKGEVVLKAASGPGAELLRKQGLRLKIGREGITGWVAHTGQTLLCNDVSREPHYYHVDLLSETRSELAVPLRIGRRTIGVLDVQSNRSHAFDKEDVFVLQILGSQVSTAIENARLFQETKRRYEAMSALHETSLDVISQLDMAELLDSLLRRGVKLCGAQAGTLFRYDAAQDLIYNVANYNTGKDWTGVTLRPGEGVIGQVILEESPLLVNEYERWGKKAEVFIDVPYTAVMGAPLKWQDEIIGGIVVLDERQPGPFDRDDLWLLKLFADLATIAIKNAELHARVTAFSEELEQKVQERTCELMAAKEEITVKAEQLRALLAKTIHIQDEERARIARDMHDGVIQLITAARYELRAARVATNLGSATEAQKKLNAAREVLDEMEREIRNAIYDLTPPVLDAVGLLTALQKYTVSFQALSGITAQMQIAGTPLPLPATVEVAVFRLVEEALHNVATHSQAAAVSVTLDFQPNRLCVTVQDDGEGFNYEEWLAIRDYEHLGLLGMQERVRNLGGNMEVVSGAGRGTRVTFHLPLQSVK